METKKTPKVRYGIEPTESGYTGRRAYNVVDKNDGFVFDTFDTRKEAEAWIKEAKSPSRAEASPL